MKPMGTLTLEGNTTENWRNWNFGACMQRQVVLTNKKKRCNVSSSYTQYVSKHWRSTKRSHSQKPNKTNWFQQYKNLKLPSLERKTPPMSSTLSIPAYRMVEASTLLLRPVTSGNYKTVLSETGTFVGLMTTTHESINFATTISEISEKAIDMVRAAVSREFKLTTASPIYL